MNRQRLYKEKIEECLEQLRVLQKTKALNEKQEREFWDLLEILPILEDMFMNQQPAREERYGRR